MLKINNMPNALVVIPTFNEIENIERIIRTVFSLPKKFDILVVDDNSPDGTSEAVQLLKNEFSNFARMPSPVKRKKDIKYFFQKPC